MNILTFDIEDWFHTHENRHQYSGHIWRELPSRIEKNTDRVLAWLEASDLKATFFVLGWVAKYYPALVKKIHSKGHEIGAHSFWHHNPHFISAEYFEKDLKQCLDVLQDITGEKVMAYRAPGFNLKLKDKWAFDILAKYGIKTDSSVQLSKSPGGIPFAIKTVHHEVLEFPLVTTFYGLPYSGGGYFRALPFSFVQYLFRQEQYHLFYFHPRDFDPDLPVTNLFSFFRNQLNRINTKRCMIRLSGMLQAYPAVSMGTAAESYLSSLNRHV